MNAKLLLRERRRQGGRQTQRIGLLSGDNLMLEFSLTGTEDCTSLEKGVSNVRSRDDMSRFARRREDALRNHHAGQ